MKIAVVTVHDSANFGSFLQAYAMNHVLEEDGHEVYFAITRDKKYVKGLYYKFVLSREAVLHPFRTLKNIFYGRKKYKLFKAEQECFKEISADEIKNCDMTILGSDEIWNIRTDVFRYPVFYGKYSEKAIAYAVSAGLAKPEEFDKYPEIKEYIKKIESPLVRDENTANCVEKITGTYPETVCDPTLLADAKIYNKTYEDEYINQNKCLMLYLYQPDVKTRNIIIDFARKKGLKLVSVGFYYDWCDYNVICSPLEFCSVLKKAEYVITTTFHGTIFSVINNKKFVSIPLSQKTDDIISKFGLDEIKLNFENLSAELLEEKLCGFSADYDRINEKIVAMREDSLSKLRERIRG